MDGLLTALTWLAYAVGAYIALPILIIAALGLLFVICLVMIGLVCAVDAARRRWNRWRRSIR
jgi:uncharacterized membrane protein YoaK (UPF0700 family)